MSSRQKQVARQAVAASVASTAEVQAQLLRIHAVASLLGVSVRTLWQWVAEGRLQAVKLGPKTTRIERSEVERFIAEAKARSAR